MKCMICVQGMAKPVMYEWLAGRAVRPVMAVAKKGGLTVGEIIVGGGLARVLAMR